MTSRRTPARSSSSSRQAAVGEADLEATIGGPWHRPPAPRNVPVQYAGASADDDRAVRRSGSGSGRWRSRVALLALLGATAGGVILLALQAVSARSSAALTPSRDAPSRPGAANTGVPRGTALRPFFGDLVVTRPGAVYDALDIHGFVKIKAPRVRISRSIVRGGTASTDVGLVTDTDPRGTGLVIEDSELVPEHPNAWIDAVKGSNFTLKRVNAHGTVDGVKVHGDHVRVESSWVHDLVRYDVDPGRSAGPTHNDGVQVLGGRDIWVTGSDISGAANAGLMVTQDVGVTTDLHFNGNWVDGGECSVNLAHKRLQQLRGLELKDNRFGRHSHAPGCALLMTNSTEAALSENVWQDDQTPVRVRRVG